VRREDLGRVIFFQGGKGNYCSIPLYLYVP
jgi:hypothetical protein